MMMRPIVFSSRRGTRGRRPAGSRGPFSTLTCISEAAAREVGDRVAGVEDGDVVRRSKSAAVTVPTPSLRRMRSLRRGLRA